MRDSVLCPENNPDEDDGATRLSSQGAFGAVGSDVPPKGAHGDRAGIMVVGETPVIPNP